MVPNAGSFSWPYREEATFWIPHNPCSPLSPVNWSCQWNSWQLEVNPTNLVMFRTHGGCQTYLLRNLYSKSEELGIQQQERSLTDTGYWKPRREGAAVQFQRNSKFTVVQRVETQRADRSTLKGVLLGCLEPCAKMICVHKAGPARDPWILSKPGLCHASQ